MTLREKLLNGDVQKKQGAIMLATEASVSQSAFAELMECFFSGNYRLTQRAASIASNAVAINQKLIAPYVTEMIERLVNTNAPVALVRNVLRILKLVDVPVENHGAVMNACFILASKTDEPVAVKAFSLSILKKLSVLYPEITDELKLVAHNSMMNKSAAIRNVAKKILK